MTAAPTPFWRQDVETFLERAMAAQRAIDELIKSPPPARDPADLETMKSALALLMLADKLRRGGESVAELGGRWHGAEGAAKLEAQARTLLRDAIDVVLVLK